MSAEENLALVRRFFEAQGEGDLDALDQILAEDFVDRSLLPSEDPDREVITEHDEGRSLGDVLLEELYSFTGEGWEQEDDITLLTLRSSTARIGAIEEKWG